MAKNNKSEERPREEIEVVFEAYIPPLTFSVIEPKTNFFSTSVLSNMANEEAGIANVNQLPGTDGITSPLKDAVTNTSF